MNCGKSFRTILLACFLLLVVLAVLITLIIVWAECWSMDDYQLNGIENYGQYPGVREDIAEKYIYSFLPENIPERATNVDYHFASNTWDAYGFEVYLEFTLEDPEVYCSYVAQVTADMVEQPFAYDTQFTEYIFVNNAGVVCDQFSLTSGQKNNEQEANATYYSINDACILKILANSNEQRIIFVSLHVADGGASDTMLLGKYLNRFQINPIEYEKTHPFRYINK